MSNGGYLSVEDFPAHSYGDARPKLIAGPSTGLVDPVGIFVDSFDHIFVANDVIGGTVVEFPPGKTGNVTPVAAISGSNTGLELSYDVVLDGAGNIYVTNRGLSETAGTVTEYPPGSNGNAAPSATIGGAQTGLAGPAGIVIDGSGVIYVANSAASSITEYAAGSTGNVAPIAAISGSSTGLDGPVGITLDSAGNIYVTNYTGDSVVEFAAGSTGDAAPIATISGSSTQLSSPSAVAVDSSRNIYVSNYLTSSVTEYAAGSSGDVAPIVTISGTETQLLNPQSLAIASIFPTAPPSSTPTPTPTPRSIFSISPNPIVFPTVGVGTTPSARTFTITNPGAKASGNVDASNLTSTKAYKVKGEGAFTLAHGASKTVEILFAPPVGLAFSGNINVTSKSPKSLGIVNVTGIGQGGTLSVPNAPLVFPNEPVGQTSAAKTLTIQNTGVGALQVTVKVYTLGNGAGVFAVGSGQGTFTLKAGKKLTVSVQFTPKAKKKYLESLNVTSDDPNNLLVPVLLSGTGT